MPEAVGPQPARGVASARQAGPVIGPIRAVVAVSSCAALALATLDSPPEPPVPAPATPVIYVAPLPRPLTVVRGFDPPESRYGAGHLGVDLGAMRRARVVAAAAGVVSFAGPVAGRGIVVIVHPDGVRTEYEPVAPLVKVGARVRGGDLIGVLTGRHDGCTRPCLHWGARRGDTYLDPLDLLRPLGPVVLVPDRGPPSV